MFGIGLVLASGGRTVEQLTKDGAFTAALPDKSTSNPAEAWKALCAPSATAMPSLRRLCDASTADDINIFVAAGNRLVRKVVLQYAAVRWYGCTASAASCVHPPCAWAAELLGDGLQKELLQKDLLGPFHGPQMALDVRGGPMKGPLAEGPLLDLPNGPMTNATRKKQKAKAAKG